jgi:putative protease
LGDTRYLLSPQDLAAQPLVPELVAAGVHCFKIEGRYKNAAYVLTAVDALRHARDAGTSAAERAQLKGDLARTRLTFSRGASLGFLGGDDHQTLVQGRTPKHRGIHLGRVVEVRGREVRIELAHDAAANAIAPDELPRAGMGVMFDVGDPERDDAPGGPIFSVRFRELLNKAPQLELGFGQHGQVGPDLSRVRHGVDVWLTGDPELQREAERRSAQALPGRISVVLRVRGALGTPLTVLAEARFAGRSVRAAAASGAVLSAARNAGLDDALLADKLAALGGTPFRLEQLDTTGLATSLHLPVSELKAVRRELVTLLEQQLSTPAWQIAHASDHLPALRLRTRSQLTAAEAPARIVPLCRTLEQLEAVIASGVTPGDEVELDWMELVGLAKAVELARSRGLKVTIATVRVQKPGEESYDRRIKTLAPDAVLVRHWGALVHFGATRTVTTHGDFSLNVTNSITARHVLALGLDTLTASHDLDRTQLLAVLAEVPRGRVAVTLHHHIPTFHNSHCVYAHLLSTGKDFRSCGRPCEEHRVALRDFAGLDHPVIVDVSCRNTVFNALAQSAAPLVPTLLERGVHRFRVEFVWENGEQVARTLAAYRGLLRAEISANAAMRAVGVHEQYGVTVLRG